MSVIGCRQAHSGQMKPCCLCFGLAEPTLAIVVISTTLKNHRACRRLQNSTASLAAMSNSPWEHRIALLARHLTGANVVSAQQQAQELQAAATAVQVWSCAWSLLGVPVLPHNVDRITRNPSRHSPPAAGPHRRRRDGERRGGGGARGRAAGGGAGEHHHFARHAVPPEPGDSQAGGGRGARARRRAGHHCRAGRRATRGPDACAGKRRWLVCRLRFDWFIPVYAVLGQAACACVGCVGAAGHPPRPSVPATSPPLWDLSAEAKKQHAGDARWRLLSLRLTRQRT